MIFSRQQLDAALEYTAAFYDKVILVDFNNDSFKPIKVSDKEWRTVPSYLSFTNWIRAFCNSADYKALDDGNNYRLRNLTDIDFCRNLKHNIIINYRKIINDGYHIVQTELYPKGDGLAYLFVKDITLFNKKEINTYDKESE